MMLPNDIEKLLARFYAGETTAEEEQTLKEYFARTDVLLPCMLTVTCSVS